MLEYLAAEEGPAVVGGLRLLLLVDEVDELVAGTSMEHEKGAGGQSRAWMSGVRLGKFG